MSLPIKKVALITGSGKRRVGNVVARRLAWRGYSIAIHYNRSAYDARETVEELTSLGIQASAHQADLAHETHVQKLVDETLENYGRIDVLVTAAAIWERKRLEDVTADDVRRYFDINTLATFLCCQKVGLAMVNQPEGGSIVTIGDWAIERPYLDYAAYFPSKGAIPTMTRTLAVELAHRNPKIRVNCVLPGPVMMPTELSPEEVQAAVAGTVLQRGGSPEDVAQAVEFFIENDFVTGVCLPVDGGRTIAT